MKGYWNNLRPFEKRVVVGVASLVFVVLNIWFVLPHFSDWGKVQKRTAKAYKTLAAFQLEIAQIPFYQTNIAILEGQSGGRAVPHEDQASQFDRAIIDHQTQTGVNVTSKGGPKFHTNQFFLEVTENLTVTSPEKPLVDFLYDLGSADSLIRVRDLTLKPADMVQRQQLNATMRLVASYQKNPPKPKPAPATPAAAKPATAGIRPALPPGKAGTATNPPPNAAKPPAIPAPKQATPKAKQP